MSQLKPIRLNLGARLLLVLLLVGLLPLVVTGIVNIISTSDTLRDRVINDEQIGVQGKANQIERALGTTVDDVRLLSQSVSMQTLAQAIVEKQMLNVQPARQELGDEFANYVERRELGGRRIYARIRFLDQDGFEFVRVDDVNGTVESVMNLNYRSDADYFVNAKDRPEGEIYVSPINLFDEYGRIQRPFTPVLQYATPVYYEGTFVGVLVTDVQAQLFFDLVQADLAPKTTAFLVDQDGYYLSHPDAERLFGRDLETGARLQADWPQLDTALTSPTGDVSELKNDIAVYQRITPPGQQGRYWVLFSLRPLDTVLEPVRQQQITLALALVIAAALVGAFALYLARGISRPIVDLTRTSASIASGNLKQRVQIARSDEIGDLAQSFNSMTDQLRGLIDTLEDRVNARTRDLQIASDVSRQITTVLDIDRLLQDVVTLTTRGFDLYAAFVFRFNPERALLVRAAGIDAKGNPLTQTDIANIPLKAEPSIVALAARTRRAVIVNDVTISPTFRSQTLLPETRSELAIPLVLGERLLGVFDLQARQKDRFSPDDLRVLTSLAEQITIAVRNAQLFAEAQQSREFAEEANRVKSQFMANMSHELRTPLNAILNFAEFVADGILGPINEEQENALQQVVSSGDHLLSLINDILDLTKIEVGMMDFFVEDVNLRHELENVMVTGKGLVENRPVKLVTRFAHDLPPTIQGDARRIHQVFLNLVSNAIKFTQEGSVTVIADREGDRVHVAIQDTGAGIAAEDMELIFDRFRQAEQGVKARTGTGLGLPISKYFVEAHGGRIWVESQPGSGSTFNVELPIRQPDDAAEPAATPAQEKSL